MRRIAMRLWTMRMLLRRLRPLRSNSAAFSLKFKEVIGLHNSISGIHLANQGTIAKLNISFELIN
jgi:hypothetical protein